MTSPTEAAKAKILSYSDPEYWKAHERPITDPRHEHYQFGDQELEMVGSRHVNDPESSMMRSTLDYVDAYLGRVPKEKQLVMVEGFHQGAFARPTLEESARKGGEPMAVAFVALQAGAEVISPEVPANKVAEATDKKAIDRRDLALFYAVRNIPGSLRNDRLPAEAALRACFDAGLITKEEIDESFQAASESALAIINAESEKLTGKEYGRSDYNLSEDEAKRYCDPSVEEHLLNTISAVTSKERDEYILEKLEEAISSGKSPLLVYGASHIVRLKPAAEYLVNDKKS